MLSQTVPVSTPIFFIGTAINRFHPYFKAFLGFFPNCHTNPQIFCPLLVRRLSGVCPASVQTAIRGHKVPVVSSYNARVRHFRTNSRKVFLPQTVQVSQRFIVKDRSIRLRNRQSILAAFALIVNRPIYDTTCRFERRPS